MSFQRNKRITSNSTPIDSFGESLTRIANATVNLDNSITNAAILLNIPSRTLSMMLLSTDPNQIHCVTLIRNLAESLREYPNGVLPEQLSQYIVQLNQHIHDNPVTEDGLPSFFELICPIIHQPVIIDHIPFNEQDNEEWNDYENTDEEDHPIEHVILTPVSEQNIKDDLCVICFINLNQEPNVVETICKHQYHNNCITNWIQIKKCCPLCNGNL